MKVKDLILPEAYSAFASKYQALDGFCNLRLINEQDAFNETLETELAQVYVSESQLREKSEALKQDFVCDGYYGEPGDVSDEPGAIADITDFSNIICFGMAGDGSPFCFDYRDDRKHPSVIWWEDDHWRKIADSFEDFIALFS